MYSGVDEQTLNAAAEAGTALHKEIELYCTDGIEGNTDEFRGFQFLQRKYSFTAERNEVPLILFRHEKPYAAGRCDMVVRHVGKTGGADIKRVSSLNKEYVGYQLNLYRMAYFQSYDVEWEFIWAIHLRGLKRKITALPINPKAAEDLIDEYERSRYE